MIPPAKRQHERCPPSIVVVVVVAVVVVVVAAGVVVVVVVVVVVPAISWICLWIYPHCCSFYPSKIAGSSHRVGCD